MRNFGFGGSHGTYDTFAGSFTDKLLLNITEQSSEASFGYLAASGNAIS